jgi:sulfite reductase (ferredoxin)
MFAQRLEAFVTPERAAETWAAVTGLFREYGYRRSRNQSRLKFLVKDWGAEEFRRVLEKEFLDEPLPDGPAPAPAPLDARDHIGVHAQADGRTYVGFAPRAGRLSGHQLRLVADLAERFGSGKIRTTSRQKLVIIDVDETSTAELTARLDELDLPAAPSPFRKGVMACTGIEFCKLAIGETKKRARWLAEELDQRLPGLSEEIRIHVNGCPNSCARFQVADIGLMSALSRRPDGTKSDAFLVHLGGTVGDGVNGEGSASFGRKVKGVRIFAEDAADYVETLVKRYRARRGAEGPSFTEFVRRMNDEELTVFATPEGGP